MITDKTSGVYEVLEATKDKFRTAFKPEGDKVIVFGREVDDFRALDYDAVSILNVSATQELARKVDAQESKLAVLRAELAKLRGEKASLTSTAAELNARDQAREDRLARLESSLEKISTSASFAYQKQP